MFTILAISDSDKHFSSAISEYEKRLWKSMTIENIRPCKNWDIQKIISADTEKIISFLQKKHSDYYKILLSKTWKFYSTAQLSNVIKNKNILFVIWWPYGLDEEKLTPFVNEKISFWAITLPHWLAKLNLLEQIYRITTIWQNKNYHY